MAAAIGGAEPPVIDQLRNEPYRFNFYQLVRLLEMLKPDSKPVGMASEPHKEPVRFRSSFGLGFPASDIADVKLPADLDSGQPEVMVNFLGLGGAHGPLPHPMTEWVLERNAAKDYALRDFLDIFNHRLVSLLYRVRRESRLGLEGGSPENQQFSKYLLGLMGILTEGLRDRLKIPDRALLRYAGLLTKKPRDAVGLQTMLSDFFKSPVRCLQLQGAMRTLDKHEWTTIGQHGRNNSLGLGALVGTAVWDQEAGIEIELGPVTWAHYCEFLPGESGLQALCQLVRFYIGPSFDIHVSLLLQGSDIPVARLGQVSAAPAPALGLTSFLSYGMPLQGTPRVRLGAVARYSDEPQRIAP